jgi:nucleoside-diphosphate-sugar epimerase
LNEPCFFVTGAAGFVGRHLCQHLRAAGHRVRALVRHDRPDLTAIGVELFHGDLAEPDAWSAGLVGADYIVHCAANASFGNGPAHETVNVAGTRHLLEAVRRHGPALRRFVFVSTIGAVDRAPADACRAPLDEDAPLHPSSDYGRSKARAEQLVRESGLPFAIVRPALVVGGDMRPDSHFAVFTRAAVRRAPLARFAWPGRFSVVHVDDLTVALKLCAVHPAAAGRTFFCAGSPLGLREAFALAEPAGARLPLDWASALARALPRAVPFRLKALLLPALTASDAALQHLGWVPRHTAASALADVITRERARLDPHRDPGGQTVITGAASGLGRAFVERLAPHRRHLLLVDRDPAGLDLLRTRYPQCRVAVVDLADDRAVAQLVDGADWRAHPVSELFACAGFGLRGPVLGADAAAHARLFQVNLLARLALAHAALPGMVRAGFGRVVFISSSSAFQPLPFLATYAASNAALLSMSEAWAAELTGTGVRLLVACPGGMQTNFQRSAGVKTLPSERLMAPEEVADRLVRALPPRPTTVIISTRSLAMSLLARVLPRAATVALWKNLMSRLR